MGETDLQHLPEAVNREILKNSREIIFEEPETSREGSPLLRSSTRRNLIRHPLLDEERRSLLYSSKRSLYHRNILRGLDEDKRSLDGSRKNLTASRRYLLIPLDSRSTEPSGKENLHVARRHTGSRERLNAMRRNIYAMKGSKETPELGSRGGYHSNDDRLMIETEKSVRSPRVQRILLSENNRTSLSDPNLSPSVYSKNGQPPVPIPVLPISPPSDLSPESGIYEGTHWTSSPEYVRKDLGLAQEAVISRNRRSYENAQLQDVNEALSRPSSDHSSLDSEESSKNFSQDLDPSRGYSNEKKTTIAYTSV